VNASESRTLARMLRLLAALAILTSFLVPAFADEHVIVAAQRLPANGALFIADARGYFKAEGLDVEMIAYASEGDVAQAVASGTADVGLSAYSPQAFEYAGQGLIKFVAGQISEKKGFEGAEVVTSTSAWMTGTRQIEKLAGNDVAFSGTPAHFQLTQIARAKKIDIAGITLKPMPTEEDVARAVATQKVHAAILSDSYARDLLMGSQAQLIGWYSELAGPLQLGAVFASTKLLETKRARAAKFVRAYRRGAADYAGMLELDRSGKRSMTVVTRELATIVARYAYPGHSLGRAAASVEGAALPIEPGARLVVEDLARQLAWCREQKLVETSAGAKEMVDEALAIGR
jgi:NitT/TauT family transport system substrate-binding protein